MKPSLSSAAIQTAKQSLRGRWPSAIGVLGILTAALAVSNMLMLVIKMLFSSLPVLGAVATVVVAIVQIFAFFPLCFGVLDWFRQTAYGAAEPIGTVFRYYETKADYIRALDAMLAVACRLVLTVFVFSLPAAFFYTVAGRFSANGKNEVYIVSLMAVSLVLEVFGLLFALLVSTRWFAVIPCMLADENLSVHDAVLLSKIMTKYSRADLFGFFLRFAGWALLSLLVLPLIFTAPYFMTACFCRARFMIRRFCLTAETAPQ